MLAVASDPLEALVVDWVNARLDGAAKYLEDRIRKRAPKDTHALSESLIVEVDASGDSAVFVVRSRFESTNEYGLFQDEGRGPFEINVKDAKVLTDGTSFFGVRVQHPGYTKHVGWFSDAPWGQWLCEAFE